MAGPYSPRGRNGVFGPRDETAGPASAFPGRWPNALKVWAVGLVRSKAMTAQPLVSFALLLKKVSFALNAFTILLSPHGKKK